MGKRGMRLHAPFAWQSTKHLEERRHFLSDAAAEEVGTVCGTAMA